MRNTHQYPITVDECITALVDVREYYLSLIYLGDIRPYSAALIAEFLEENREELEKFLIEKCTK